MQCPICDASIEEIEVSTCPSCGTELIQPVFPEEEECLLDGHDGNIVSLDDFRVESKAAQPGRDALMASEEEEADAERFGEAQVALHHPSHSPRRKLKPVKFFLFRVNLGGKIHFIWVRSTAKTPAVEQLLKWIRNEMGWRPCDSAGQEFPWGLSGRDLAIKYKAEMPLVGELDTLPDDAAFYINAYYVEKPIKVDLRD
jgi:hypothetical protein